MTGRVTDGEFVDGTISSAGWADGSRCAIGSWWATPLGPFGDVMWVAPSGERILYAPNDEVADYISSIYRFDRVETGELTVVSDGRRTHVVGLGLRLSLIGGRLIPMGIPRPRVVTRFIERPIARALMGVNTYGVSPLGVREWYQARGVRWVRDGSAERDGVDLGAPRPIDEPLRVGFSEPPRRPSIVQVHVAISRPW